MSKRITPGEIRRNNRQQIYNYIYERRKVSQQDIAYALQLSRPTVSANVAALEADGLIRRDGQLQSDQIGRKATGYAIDSAWRVAVGVEIRRACVRMEAVNLYGESLRRDIQNVRFANEAAYYREICAGIRAFIDALGLQEGRVLGIGITAMGLASADGRTLVYGAILGCTGLSIEVFERWLGYPCAFIHDSDAAALSELWVCPDITDAVYLSLSRHLGASVIANRRVMMGRHGHSATFEHIQVRPRGLQCYCGRRGCWDTLCSMKALVNEADADVFFAAVRRGEMEPAQRWEAYLKNLARLIGDLHLVHDVDFILGGRLAYYITEEDIQALYREIRKSCPFDEPDDFLRLSKMPSHSITIGASLPFIRRFLDDIDAAAGA